MSKKKGTNLRKLCVTWAKKVALLRDGYVCRRCKAKKGKKEDGGKQIQGSHIMPDARAYDNTAANPDNIIALCSGCHKWKSDSWHRSPLEGVWWIIGELGKDKLQTLMFEASEEVEIDWEAKLIILKEQYKCLQSSLQPQGTLSSKKGTSKRKRVA